MTHRPTTASLAGLPALVLPVLVLPALVLTACGLEGVGPETGKQSKDVAVAADASADGSGADAADLTSPDVQGGCPTSCDDGNPCTSDDCGPDGKCSNLHAKGVACDDGDPCTSDDVCGEVACQGKPMFGLQKDDAAKGVYYAVTGTPDGGGLAAGWTADGSPVGIARRFGRDVQGQWTWKSTDAGSKVAAVAYLPSGEFLLVGQKGPAPGGSTPQAWWWRLDAQGQETGSGGVAGLAGAVEVRAVAPLSSGVLLAGTTAVGQAWVVRLDAAGKAAWTALLGDKTAKIQVHALRLQADVLVVAGQRATAEGLAGWAAKLSLTGKVLADKVIAAGTKSAVYGVTGLPGDRWLVVGEAVFGATVPWWQTLGPDLAEIPGKGGHLPGGGRFSAVLGRGGQALALGLSSAPEAKAGYSPLAVELGGSEARTISQPSGLGGWVAAAEASDGHVVAAGFVETAVTSELDPRLAWARLHRVGLPGCPPAGCQANSGSCDDGKACTLDACDVANGACSHDTLSLPCEGQNACDWGGTCQAGVCQGFQAAGCDDLTPCTLDSCSSATGCVHLPASSGTPCDDGDPCLADDTCQGEVCTPGTKPLFCQDKDPCTADACDPKAGCIAPPIADGLPCQDVSGVCLQGQCKKPFAKDLFAGWGITCALTGQDVLSCWAGTDQGIGNTPAPPVGLEQQTWKSFGLGLGFGCGLTMDGKVHCIGQNDHGQAGQAAGGYVDFDAKAPIALKADAVDLAVGATHACAVVSPDLHVRCWGLGKQGQLGNGDDVDHSDPVKVSGLAGVKALSAGTATTCAILQGGQTWCWGAHAGGWGEGKGSGQSTLPKLIADLPPLASLSVGDSHACGLTPAGSVVCWGISGASDLCCGVPDPYPATGLLGIVKDIGQLTGVSRLAVGSHHTCALGKGPASPGPASVWCWGTNAAGQLGLPVNDLANKPLPVPLPGLATPTALAARDKHTCVTDVSGAVLCWGTGGTGSPGKVGVPTLVPGTLPLSIP